ncbi:MAG: inosine/xanthosine triphosphatase [Candidatus Promineifilaceae bacterium]|nr:inosine/xanthosine triphosphatase [Candidatus Promineifilaceae bacterium]
MKIAVGSRNPAKLHAVRVMVQRAWPDATVTGVAVPSGVAAMPLSDAACLAGARNRALGALQASAADLGVGLEGGVSEAPSGMMLLGWVVIVDAAGREGIGSTGRLSLPPAIAARVRAGEELGPVMDALLGETKSNHRGGAIGALTGGLVPRAQAFSLAVAYALAPFVAPDFYR